MPQNKNYSRFVEIGPDDQPKEVLQDVKLYTDGRPEIMSMYKRLAHEAPK